MVKYILVGSFLILATGCQTSKISASGYSVNSDSRIRLYGQNQKPMILEYIKNGKKEKINVGGQASDAFSSLIGTVKNQSIGIAQTQMSKSLKDHNGVFSKIFYKEIVIPAGSPVSIRGAFIGLTNVSESSTRTTIQYEGTCTSSGLTFIPKAGKDYEIVPKYNSSSCGLTLLEVDSNGNTAEVNFNK
ncbi:hypothetical protein [Acinetobacter seifertii]|uniref:hypothetical protein n=1 Tax=Acinetobacter seifertii TaxID=1530123 RepID=UPI00168A5084|nr:hypothetical protein [Acinetobacter seifertii]QNX59512.1 hypothetical protein IC781_12240 [Acinetobacter seifertii]